MFNKAKYVVYVPAGYTFEVMIVFPFVTQHKEFRSFEPIRAGFISFGAEDKYRPTVSCWGESISLGLKSDPEKDQALAERNILCNSL